MEENSKKNNNKSQLYIICIGLLTIILLALYTYNTPGIINEKKYTNLNSLNIHYNNLIKEQNKMKIIGDASIRYSKKTLGMELPIFNFQTTSNEKINNFSNRSYLFILANINCNPCLNLLKMMKDYEKQNSNTNLPKYVIFPYDLNTDVMDFLDRNKLDMFKNTAIANTSDFYSALYITKTPTILYIKDNFIQNTYVGFPSEKDFKQLLSLWK